MFRIGLSTCGKPFGEKLFADYAGAGITAMEISYGKAACEAFDFRAARTLSERYGVELWSFHLPFMPFEEIDISEPSLCGASVKYLSEMMQKAADAGIKRFIIHPSGEPIAETDRAARLETSRESLAALAEKAAACGAVMAVEDLPRSCIGRDSEDILRLLSADDCLRVCLDTNHLLRENIIDFIARVGDRIITTHVSDYDGKDEKHWLPGEGINDWQAIAASLKKAGYDGVWLYEVGYKAPKTITRGRELTPADFARNAEAVFSGRAFEKI